MARPGAGPVDQQLGNITIPSQPAKQQLYRTVGSDRVIFDFGGCSWTVPKCMVCHMVIMKRQKPRRLDQHGHAGGLLSISGADELCGIQDAMIERAMMTQSRWRL